MTATEIIDSLIAAEVDHRSYNPGEREVLRRERMVLQTVLRTGTADDIRHQMLEALRVAKMYGAV